MGLLEELLAGAMGGATGQPAQARQQAAAAGGGNMGRILMALMPVVLAMLAGRQGGGGAQGGGLGDILGPMTGGGAARGGGGNLGDILGQMMGGGAAPRRGGGADMSGGLGGLSDLLRQLEAKGYGEQANSWVGAGRNMPIPPDAMSQIFGPGGLAQIAQYTGLSERETSEGLTQLLPEVVNHVTPDGQVPELDQLMASVEGLARQLRA